MLRWQFYIDRGGARLPILLPAVPMAESSPANCSRKILNVTGMRRYKGYARFCIAPTMRRSTQVSKASKWIPPSAPMLCWDEKANRWRWRLLAVLEIVCVSATKIVRLFSRSISVSRNRFTRRLLKSTPELRRMATYWNPADKIIMYMKYTSHGHGYDVYTLL